MTRFDVIEKNYKFIQQVSKSLLKDWRDFSHDMVEYLLTVKADIVALDNRNEFQPWFRVVAFRRMLKVKRIKFDEIKDIQAPEIEEDNHIDDIDKLKSLNTIDKKILCIFSESVTITEVAKKTTIHRETLSKMLKTARINAKKLL